ncbi:MAG: glucose-6-phosphate dehydrogenase [Spongiibacteraceae bacterium]|nr:glucose-6-phosphate dehydrogenase [Spongiibacteraceae bacterium]
MNNVFDFIVFGGMGDLSIRKLLPALYRGERDNTFAPSTRIVLISRGEKTQAQAIRRVQDGLKKHLTDGEYENECWNRFKQRIHYVSIDLVTSDERWQQLSHYLDSDRERIRVCYLATPPSLYADICINLDANDLITPATRIVLEKPLGYDHASASAINAKVAEYFDETNIYRIDHYLGKETVQNLLTLRFGNAMFEPLWDKKLVDHIQITIAESVGLEGRAGFYDNVGALRDMVQNHLLQLLCLVAMEPPTKLDAENIRAEKLKVLKALRRIDDKNIDTDTVRGRYTSGVVNAVPVPGYQDELGEAGKDSQTETYVAIKAYIDNWRWSGVPFYLRTGKRLEKRFAEIVIQYRSVSHRVFDDSAGAMQPNRLVIRLQPDEGIQLTLMTKELRRRAIRMCPATLNLDFSSQYDKASSDAYLRLILDVVEGNPSLFAHREEVEHAWSWIDPIIEAWRSQSTPLLDYPAGSRGPSEVEGDQNNGDHHWFI